MAVLLTLLVRRWSVGIAGAIWVVAMAFARTYLGVHWLTDTSWNPDLMVPGMVVACVGGNLPDVHFSVIDGSILVILYPLTREPMQGSAG